MNGDLANASGYTNFIDSNKEVVNKYYNGMSTHNYKFYNKSNYNEDYAKYLELNNAAFSVPANVTYIDNN